jgi:hypothetical protein
MMNSVIWGRPCAIWRPRASIRPGSPPFAKCFCRDFGEWRCWVSSVPGSVEMSTAFGFPTRRAARRSGFSERPRCPASKPRRAGRARHIYSRPIGGGGHFVGVVRVLDRVCAEAKLKDVTPHVLRHTFASVAGDLGFSELTIAGLLGHSARGVTQGYVHLDTALVVAADRVSARIAELLDGVASGTQKRRAHERRSRPR